MPFKSEKQRRYLHANHPEIAKRWERDYANGGITLPKGPAGITSLNGWGSTDESQNVAGADITPSMDRNPNDPGWGGGDNPPSTIKKVVHTGPTAAEIEAAKQKKLLEQQQRRAKQYSDFYGKFKGDTKKKTDYLSRLLKNDPLYETYKAKGLLDWDNIKSYEDDINKLIENKNIQNKGEQLGDLLKLQSGAWGYTAPWDRTDDSLYIADIEKFDPTWTPGWTGDSEQEELNKRIAHTIGHEARHQVLGEGMNAPYRSLFTNEEKKLLKEQIDKGEVPKWVGETLSHSWAGDPYSQKVDTNLANSDVWQKYQSNYDSNPLNFKNTHELVTTMGDFQSYNDPTIYDDIYGTIHGNMPRHLSSNVADELYDASLQAGKDFSARTVGEKYENIDPVMVEGLKRAYPDENLDEALKEMSTRQVMDLLQDDYEYGQDKKAEMEKGGSDMKAMSALTTPIEGLGGFSYADTKTLLDAGYDPEEVSTWENNEGLELLKSLKNFKKGGVARKKYSTGGILDITGEEEITTEEGNDISLVDETETGVSTLFKEKNNDYAVQGGVKNYLGEQEMVNAPKYWQSAPDHPETELTYITKPEKDLLVKADLHGSLHGSVNKGPEGIISLNGWGDADDGFGEFGGTTTGGGGGSGSTNRERGIQKAYEVTGPAYSKEQERKKDLSNLVKTGPGSWEEKFDTEKQIVQGAGATSLKRAQINTTLVRDRVTPRINELRAKIKSRFTPTKLIDNIVSKSIPVIALATSMKDQWEISRLTKELVEALKAEKAIYEDLGYAPFHHAVDTPIQLIDQEILNLTQKDTRDEDTKGDGGPEVPVVAPVTEEIGDSYAMVGDWMSRIRGDRWKVAYLDKLERQAAELQENRDFQENTMFLNSGGLANLFRVKNY